MESAAAASSLSLSAPQLRTVTPLFLLLHSAVSELFCPRKVDLNPATSRISPPHCSSAFPRQKLRRTAGKTGQEVVSVSSQRIRHLAPTIFNTVFIQNMRPSRIITCVTRTLSENTTCHRAVTFFKNRWFCVK